MILKFNIKYLPIFLNQYGHVFPCWLTWETITSSLDCPEIEKQTFPPLTTFMLKQTFYSSVKLFLLGDVSLVK